MPNSRLASLRLICSTLEINPGLARLSKPVPTFSPNRAPLVPCGKITSQPYLFFNLDWRSAADKVKNPRYRHNAITALAYWPIPLVYDIVTLPPMSLHLTDSLPHVPGVVPSYARLKLCANQLLLSDWSAIPPPRTTLIRPQCAPILSWAWESSLQTGSTRCALEKVTSPLTPHGTILMPTRPAHCTPRPRKPSNMPSCPPPRPSIRDPAASKGSQTWPPRPLSCPTSICLLPWLSSFTPPPLASSPGCLPSPLPSTLLYRIHYFPLPPHPPLDLETRWWLYTFLYLALTALRRLLVTLGEQVIVVSFVDC